MLVSEEVNVIIVMNCWINVILQLNKLSILIVGILRLIFVFFFFGFVRKQFMFFCLKCFYRNMFDDLEFNEKFIYFFLFRV